jgi:hypothetical protein
MTEKASQEEPQKTKYLGCATKVMRWIGRAWGLFLIVILLLVIFFWYLGSAGGAGPPGYVYLVGITIVTGMIVAWWQEGLGALVSLAGLVGFYVALWVFDKNIFRNWGWVFIIILPPIVFLLTSSLLRRHMAVKSFKGQSHVD